MAAHYYRLGDDELMALFVEAKKFAQEATDFGDDKILEKGKLEEKRNCLKQAAERYKECLKKFNSCAVYEEKRLNRNEIGLEAGALLENSQLFGDGSISTLSM